MTPIQITKEQADEYIGNHIDIFKSKEMKDKWTWVELGDIDPDLWDEDKKAQYWIYGDVEESND